MRPAESASVSTNQKFKTKRFFCMKTFLPRLFFVAVFVAVACSVSAAPAKKGKENDEPSIGYDVEVRMERGATTRIDLKGIVFLGNKGEFEIVRPPEHGSLKLLGMTKDTATYLYRHDGKVAGTDSFRWKLRTAPENAWGYRKVHIEIIEPKARLNVDPEALDFGDVFLGDAGSRKITISNAGGGVLMGRLKTGSPWMLVGDEVFSLASGVKREVSIGFRPASANLVSGVLEVETAEGEAVKVTLSGKGMLKFEAPARIPFPTEAGEAEMSLELGNLVDEPLMLRLEVPKPLECEVAEIDLPPLGKRTVRLQLPARRYLEERVTLKIKQGGVEWPVEVVLPPPPPILEWTGAPVKELGAKKAGARISLEAELRNTSPRVARVELRVEGAGLAFAGAAPGEIMIPPTGTQRLELVWALPHQAGPARASIAAESAGLKETLVWNAAVEVQAEVAAAPAASTPEPTPSGSEMEEKKEKLRSLTKQEKAALERYMPREISYRLEQEGGTATAIVSWALSDGVDGNDARIERFVVRRADTFAANPLQKRLEVPGELPESPLEAGWLEVPRPETGLRRTEGGRWEARIDGLGEGFHRLRILVPEPGTKFAHGSDFMVEVGAMPRSAWQTWGLVAALLLIGLYLLRNRLPF